MGTTEFPAAVRAAAEQEAAAYPVKKLTARAQALSERYRGEHTKGERLLTEPADAVVYALTRMPATFGAISGALKQSVLPQQPRTVLDVGAGTGAGALAAAEAFPVSKIFCMEREPAMRALGTRLLAVCEKTSVSGAEFVPGDLTPGRLTLHADLVIAGYVLNELPQAKREDILEELWGAAVQTLVIVEPGTPEGYRLLMQVRKQLLSLGAHIAAPCPSEGKCPLKKDDWCNFTCRIQRGRLHRMLKGGDVPYEDEKYCFLTATRYVPEHAECRVLRHPQIMPGRIQLTLCTESGIENLTVSKKNSSAFRLARKAECGDAFAAAELRGETE